jgi:hypothetical protein
MRFFTATSLSFAVLGATLLASSAFAAGGGAALIPSQSLKPIEERVAIATSPSRTVIWTNVRYDAKAGAFAVIVPVPTGASIDVASDAWLEALENATAPRVFPPTGASPFCSGENGNPNVFTIEGEPSHTTSPPPNAFLLADSSAVLTWASQNGLALPAQTAAALDAITGARFLALRIDATGPGVTPTIRVVMPAGSVVLPLAVTRAGADDLRVTTYAIGGGLATPTGGLAAKLSPAEILWSAKNQTTNYLELRSNAIVTEGLAGFLTESASHTSLAESISIAKGTATIESVLSSYYERASSYGDAPNDVSACIAQGAAALSSNSTLGTACPKAGLGVVDGPSSCVEGPDGTPPDHLRCGDADDLAIALSNASPGDAWVTRFSMVIPAGSAGPDLPLTFGIGASVTPVLTAGKIDDSGCGSSSSSSTSSGSSGMTSTSSSGGTSSGVVNPGQPVDDWTADNSGIDVNIGGSCDCGGGTSSTAADTTDSCSGDSGGSQTDTCGGDSSSSSDSCSGDSGGSQTDTCSGDSSGSSGCDSGGSSSSGCDSGGGSSGCSGGGEDCSIGPRVHRRPAPKASVLLLGLLAVLAPLRRRGRKARKLAQARKAAAKRP